MTISKLKSKHWQKIHKGIRIPKSVKEAFDIDKENGNIFWADTIKEEKMSKITQAVRIHNGERSDLKKNINDVEINWLNQMYLEIYYLLISAK